MAGSEPAHTDQLGGQPVKFGHFETTAHGLYCGKELVRASLDGSKIGDFLGELHAAYERGEVVVNGLHFIDAHGNEISDPRKPEPLTAPAIGEAVGLEIDKRLLDVDLGGFARAIGEAVAKALEEQDARKRAPLTAAGFDAVAKALDERSGQAR